MIGQQRPLDEDVLQRGAPVVVVTARPVPGRAVDVVAVVLGVFLPVDLADVGGCLDLGLLGVRRLPLVGAVLAVDRRDLGRTLHLLVGVLLEHRILGELVVDQRLELGARHLQDLDRLTQLRRHDELLRQPLLENDARVLSHRVRREDYYSRNFSPK